MVAVDREVQENTGVAKRISSCRSCYSEQLEEVIDLGPMHLVGFSRDDKEPVMVPLTLIRCSDCNLVQLRHTTNPKLLYQDWYGYRSGVNEHMVADLKSIATSAEEIAGLSIGDVVIDIGCNDGTLLTKYTTADIIRVGFDPARNVAQYAPNALKPFGGDKYKVFFDFFSKEPFKRIFGDQRAKVITAISMFYDLDNPNAFLKDVKEVLDPNGVFVVQQNYAAEMLRQHAFDNICHEHLTYFTLSSMSPLLERNGLEVFDIQVTDINGGSFRTYIRNSGSAIGVENGETRVSEMLQKEKEMRLSDPLLYREFAGEVAEGCRRLNSFIRREVTDGGKVYAYAASTRGNTLLQFCGLDGTLLGKAAERNPDKWGRRTVGTDIPIVSEEEARSDRPDYFLVLPWFLKDTFTDRERSYLESGGKMIFPLPRPEVVSMDNGKLKTTPLE